MNKHAKYAWFVIVFNVLVILWGAYVRATGSGAGCGAHWPLCNGNVMPLSPQFETMVEYTHRLTSGIAFLLVLGLFIIVRRGPYNAQVKKGAALSMVFMITEALVGAGLVLFKLVGENESLYRVVAISVHLINTFLLLASLSFTAWLLSGGEQINLHNQGSIIWMLGIGFCLVIFLGVSGAITALGDTLYESESLAEGIQQDFSAASNILVRLRVWHPVIAIITGLYLALMVLKFSGIYQDRTSRVFSWFLGGLFLVQLIAGIVNLLLLAPITMQIIHLLLADSVWILLVLYTVSITRQTRFVHIE